MAKQSIIQRELKKQKLVARYKQKRTELKAILMSKESSDEQKWDAMLALQKLPRSSSRTRLTRRCSITGRPHGVYRKFKMSRNKIRKMAMDGFFPGLKKASW